MYLSECYLDLYYHDKTSVYLETSELALLDKQSH